MKEFSSISLVVHRLLNFFEMKSFVCNVVHISMATERKVFRKWFQQRNEHTYTQKMKIQERKNSRMLYAAERYTEHNK